MSGINVGVGGAWKSATPFVGVGGAWKAFTAGFVGVGGVWKQFYDGTGGGGGGPPADPPVAEISPDSQSWGITPPTLRVTVGVSVSHGTAPYSYHWRVSDGAVTLSNPSSASTELVTYQSLPFECTAYCTVTDALDQSVDSNAVSVS